MNAPLSNSEIFHLALQVLQDWRVIFIAVLTIFFMSLGSYVVKYRKKIKPVKQKKTVVAPPPKEEKKEEDSEEELEEEE